jgi:multiple sugar transport system ATP-binding protein
MRDGVIMQVADPLTLYREPQNLFVAGFIGSPPMNLLTGKIQRRDAGLCFVENGESEALVIPLRGKLEKVAEPCVDKAVVLGVRPEHLGAAAADASHVPMTFTVDLAEQMGAESVIYLKSGRRSFTARIFGEHLYKPGEKFTAHINLDRAHLFDAATENAITMRMRL